MLNHGRLVKFNVRPDGCTIDALRLALRVSGLGENKARDLLPRHAWARACRSLKDDRVISVVKEEGNYIYFQFTQEVQAGDRLNYNFQAILRLDKTTGDVFSAEDFNLAKYVKSLLDAAIPKRTKADITRLIHKIFKERKGDLASWDGGGTYFIFGEDELTAKSVENLLQLIGGSMSSVRVALDGSDSDTTRSVSLTVKEHMLGLVEDFKDSCEKLTTETDDEAIQRRFSAVCELRDKVLFYSETLKEHAEEVQLAVELAHREMLAKATGVAPEPVHVVVEEESSIVRALKMMNAMAAPITGR